MIVNTTNSSYDSDGNMLTGNGRTMTYTSYDMPSTITQGSTTDTFIYGPDHARIRRQTSTATTIYVNPDNSGGLAYEKDMTSGGTTLEERVFVSAGGDPVVILKRENGTGSFVPYYTYRDSLGSTAAITNATGTPIEKLGYEPFGKRRAPDGASDPTDAITGVNTDRGFTDHEHLDDLALIHMNGRVFDPLVGRFLSADPNIQFVDDLQSFNRYSYAFNNPLNTRDPTGYFSLGSLFGDIDQSLKGFNSFSMRVDPGRRLTDRFLGTHQWALTLVETVAAYATAYCYGCGAAAVQAEVTYGETGSFSTAVRKGAITLAISYTVGSVVRYFASVDAAASPAVDSVGSAAPDTTTPADVTSPAPSTAPAEAASDSGTSAASASNSVTPAYQPGPLQITVYAPRPTMVPIAPIATAVAAEVPSAVLDQISVTAKRTPNSSQAYRACMNSFNSSLGGAVVNFFSLASPLIGPDPLRSAIEDIGGTGVKFAAHQGLQAISDSSLSIGGSTAEFFTGVG